MRGIFSFMLQFLNLYCNSLTICLILSVTIVKRRTPLVDGSRHGEGAAVTYTYVQTIKIVGRFWVNSSIWLHHRIQWRLYRNNFLYRQNQLYVSHDVINNELHVLTKTVQPWVEVAIYCCGRSEWFIAGAQQLFICVRVCRITAGPSCSSKALHWWTTTNSDVWCNMYN